MPIATAFDTSGFSCAEVRRYIFIAVQRGYAPQAIAEDIDCASGALKHFFQFRQQNLITL